jgi:dihydrofolate synthase/folylpolyglutamate synthase
MPPLGDVIARLSKLHPKAIDLNLERMHRLLQRLGHPERKLPPVIHVAGTNGKGSTIAYLRAILEAANLSVHVLTSPYLVRINESFRLGKLGGGVLVEDAELRAVLEHCERVNEGAPITIFEIQTAAAFCLFSQHPADAVLLETGLGGRLDATNVIEAPLASVITPVGMDHTEFLGDTLIKIAGEKAAIIKRGVPVISAEQAPEATAVIEQQAKRMHAPLHAARQEWHVNVERGRLVYQDERGLMDLAAPCVRSMRSGSTPSPSRRASSAPNGRRGCSGWRPENWSSWRRRAANYGSTAGTMPTAGAWWRRRSAISRSGCRGRWW